MPTTYYISGQIRGNPHYREIFKYSEEALKKVALAGDTIINPCNNFDGDTVRDVTEYLTEDLKQVLSADVIVQLPNWRESEGATREAQLALWSGKKFMKAERPAGSSKWIFTEIEAPELSSSVRGSVLDEAKHLITGDRNNAYGPPTQDFDRTAGMASAFGFQVNGAPLRGHHVAIFMMLLKVSRLAWTPNKRDSWVDGAGYAGCGAECAAHEEAVRIDNTKLMAAYEENERSGQDNYDV